MLYCIVIFPQSIFLWRQIKFRHGLPPGDGVLYYPGEVFSTDQPVASLRLERMLHGLQVEYLFFPHNFANFSTMMYFDEILVLIQFTWFAHICSLQHDGLFSWHELA